MKSKQIAAVGLAVFIATVMPVESASAQQPPSLAGTYTVVSSPPFGPSPVGQMTLGADGHYSIILARSNLPKIAAGTRDKGTAEEDKAIVGGSIGHFGTYAVDPQQKTLTFNVQASTFPNWNGATFKRALKVSGDQLTYTNASPSNGGPPNEVVWKRVK